MMGLQQSNEVDLFLAAPTHLSETMRYADITFGNRAPLFVNKPVEQMAAKLENSLLQPFSTESLPTKVIREAAYRTRLAVGRKYASFDLNRLPSQSVYHATFFPAPARIRRNASVPTLQTIYDLIPIFHPEWFTSGEQTVKQVLQSLSPDMWVTTISQATKDDFCTYIGFDPDRVVPILLAASPTLFHPVNDPNRVQAVRKRFGLGDGPYLLSLATLEPRKNIAHLIRCFGQLLDSGSLPPDLRLVLVGTKGWKFDEIMAEASRNKALAARLIFTGFIPDEELAPLYSSATAFVYPSLYEGFGLPPLEAMQCGLPVITSDIPAIKEVVGDAALRVPPTDADALCQAILTVVKSTSVQADLSAKALEQSALFSWDKFTAEHIALYKRML